MRRIWLLGTSANDVYSSTCPAEWSDIDSTIAKMQDDNATELGNAHRFGAICLDRGQNGRIKIKILKFLEIFGKFLKFLP